ncbi:MAG: phosphoethanolamine transferase [Burkholderia sp.]|jgi:glucan phosphoethanolaminetransferase (alkaline phosphatase superfamily)|nr:phosphoethanolamine transferase [Burkholderia sp.]
MRRFSSRSVVFLIVSYGLLSAVPLLPLLLGRALDESALLPAATLLSWVAIWALFKRPAYFHLLLLPAFLALPVETYLQLYFGQGISVHHLGIIAETSPAEAQEFLGNKIWLLGGVILLALGWFGLSWRAAWRTHALDWRGPSRLVVCLLLSIGLALWLYGGGVSHSSAMSAKPGPGTLPPWAQISVDARLLARSWPYGIVIHAESYRKERHYLAQLSARTAQFHFGAVQANQKDAPQIVVMVLGESSRADRWSLNGYVRDTNPLLEKEANLVSLSDMVTPVSATRLSVPVILSRKPATQSLRAGFSEPSFISAYREAGFKTFWLSNQMSFGEFDTPVSVFAKEADVTRFFNLGGFTNQSDLDDVLLAPLKNAMNDPALKKLVILHTLGNHWNYSHRHPKEFDRWKPSLFGIDKPAYTSLKLKPEINNSYDNSILYTDWLLSQVIGVLKTGPAMASMMYVADHGQTLYDGSCKLAFHGHNTQFEFHVPALVWYSDAYGAAHAEKVMQLRQHRVAPLATENIFHSLLDMADIRYPGERLDRSFFSDRLAKHVRYVDSYGWTDYDDATLKGDCKEVIGRKKPLQREK